MCLQGWRRRPGQESRHHALSHCCRRSRSHLFVHSLASRPSPHSDHQLKTTATALSSTSCQVVSTQHCAVDLPLVEGQEKQPHTEGRCVLPQSKEGTHTAR